MRNKTILTVVIASSAALLAACGSADVATVTDPGGPPSATPTPAATPSPAATPHPVASPTPTTDEIETVTVEEFGHDLLLQDEDGVRIARADGTAEVLWDEPALVLRADRRGGVVLQPRPDSRLVPGIHHLSGPGAEPSLVLEEPDSDHESVTLLDVVHTAGGPQLLLDRQVAASQSLQDTRETNHVSLVPLDGGEGQRLFAYNNWELAVGSAAYRGHPIWSYCYVECDAWELVGGEQRRIDVDTGGEGGLVDLASASGGREIAILRTLQGTDGPRTELVLHDLTGEHAEVVVELPQLGEFERYVGIDTDGWWQVLVSWVVHRETASGDFDEPLPPLVVDVEQPPGKVRQLDVAARAAFLVPAE